MTVRRLNRDNTVCNAQNRDGRTTGFHEEKTYMGAQKIGTVDTPNDIFSGVCGLIEEDA